MEIPKVHFAGVQEERDRDRPHPETGETTYTIVQPQAILRYADVTDYCQRNPDMTLNEFLHYLGQENISVAYKK